MKNDNLQQFFCIFFRVSVNGAILNRQFIHLQSKNFKSRMNYYVYNEKIVALYRSRSDHF